MPKGAIKDVQQSKISDARRDGRNPIMLTNLMWHMVLTMEVKEKDYLQVFKLTKTPVGQHIVHEQEQPPYRYELDVPCDDAVNAKVFVIDDLTHSTMLLAEEY